MNAGRIGMEQGTVSREVSFEGRGLHTGRKSRISVRPAPVGQGIVFLQLGHRGSVATIKADWRNVRDLPLCTCLTDGTRQQVRTVEHLLAAFYGSGIDNAIVEVRGSEIPLLDGSAKPFMDALRGAVEKQSAMRRVIRIIKPLQVRDGPRWIKVEPHEGFRIDVQTHVKPFGMLPWWGREIDRASFADEIAPARTFGSLTGALIAKLTTWCLRDPLCMGTSRRNAVAIFRGRVVTPGGLRFQDEFSRHRVLDFVGDLMLAGADFRAKFTCFSPVHRLARKTLESIFGDPSCYSIEGRAPSLL
jgi:UDP-3-O-[3-hydroxymyristoyl] N-acetylglucosamine deacetylase